MSRSTTTAFNDALALTVTSVGYLLQIDLSQGSPAGVTLRLCDIGDQSYGGYTWSAFDFTVSGFALHLEGLGAKPVTLTMQNLDGAMVALLLNNLVYDTPVTIYQIARGVGSPSDAPVIAEMVIDSAQIGLDVVTLQLLPVATRYAFAPRKRVDASSGLSSAVPEGTRFAWGSEIFTVEYSRG